MSTMDKTLLTASLFEGFWDRWIVHGVSYHDLAKLRHSIIAKERWFKTWGELAEEKYTMAESIKKVGFVEQAESVYRIAALYYQLNQWLIPEHGGEKLDWLMKSLLVVKKADQLSDIKTEYVELLIDENSYYGRVRIPNNPEGVIIIINPIDSTKEELFSYEMDFVEKNYVVVSFDGPGQGETFTRHGLKATRLRWERFVDMMIEYASNTFPAHDIFLFGTSSGAAWAIYGSGNEKVSKAVAVSPAFRNEEIQMPDYFMERLFAVSDETIIPDYPQIKLQKPVLLVHGKKDVMVKDEDIYGLFENLPSGKILLEYEDEGHCCNYKLPEIRTKAIEWFQGKWGMKDEF
ncbi:alpha/beta hydrolase [Robertmurraya kyonggiensis]|uniref:Alpha/beta hydrolase n=2 Tax=Robertmurraya kyonggiensis TaxID=1037680 RepID=A0A4U1D187_9BACI|nr:alpha/beta hydrolase [Robertmurraya kyonggiensis]